MQAPFDRRCPGMRHGRKGAIPDLRVAQGRASPQPSPQRLQKEAGDAGPPKGHRDGEERRTRSRTPGTSRREVVATGRTGRSGPKDSIAPSLARGPNEKSQSLRSIAAHCESATILARAVRAARGGVVTEW